MIGRWTASPFGAFADAMVEHPDGHRRLIAPSAEVAEYVGRVYRFDETVTADVTVERSPGRLHFTGGPLDVDVSLGDRDGLGRVLRAVPRRVATSVTWARLVDPLARLLLRGVRTSGRTAGGRETYGATDRHRVSAVRASWDGVDLGALADVDPPVRFGFGSTPARPSIVAVSTTVRPD